MIKTEWFPGKIQPIHIGWYERDYRWATCWCVGTARIQMCYWDGCCWSSGQGEAYATPCFVSSEQTLPWRGVLKHL